MEISKDVHKQMEKELGIPEEVCRVEDWIFERLDNGEAKKFPENFLDAINIGADLSDVCRKFKLEIQKENLELQIEQNKKFPKLNKMYEQLIAAIRLVISLYEERSAESAAWSAESAAWSAESAAWSAENAESVAYSKYAKTFLEILRKTEGLKEG